jgi:hypothetical protein
MAMLTLVRLVLTVVVDIQPILTALAIIYPLLKQQTQI